MLNENVAQEVAGGAYLSYGGRLSQRSIRWESPSGNSILLKQVARKATGFYRVVFMRADYVVDGNGLSNDWQKRYGESDPYADADTDAFNNLSEFVSGTHPTNGLAYFVRATPGLMCQEPTVLWWSGFRCPIVSTVFSGAPLWHSISRPWKPVSNIRKTAATPLDNLCEVAFVF